MFNSDASEELQLRYKMEPAKWEQSQRKTFPYNLSLGTVILISTMLPLGTYFLPFGN